MPATCGGKLLLEVSDKLCAAGFKRVAAKGGTLHTSPLRNRAQTFWKLFLVLQVFSQKGGPFSTLLKNL
jgi:hypothetical protein